VYDLGMQIAIQEKILGAPILSDDFAPFMHPPFILPALALIALLDYLPAYYAWAAIQFLLCLMSGRALMGAVPSLGNRKTLFISIVLFFPAFISILSGQDSTVLLLGISLWIYGLQNEKDRTAGLGLALTAIRPQIALLLAIPFVFKRRKVLGWFAAGAAALAAFSIALVGVNGTIGFVRILGISASGEGYRTNEMAMVNFLGLVKRWFPGTPTSMPHLGGWAVYALAAVFLCILWIRSDRIKEKQTGLAVLAAILAAPHLHYHDLILFLAPIICLISVLKKAGRPGDPILSLLPLVISWILLVSNFLEVFKYNVPYLLGLFLGLALWFPGIFFRPRLPETNGVNH
jgi:Glycosyltransferase family 87